MHLEVHLRRLNYMRPGVDDVDPNRAGVYGVAGVTDALGVGTRVPAAGSVSSSSTGKEKEKDKSKKTDKKTREMENK